MAKKKAKRTKSSPSSKRAMGDGRKTARRGKRRGARRGRLGDIFTAQGAKTGFKTIGGGGFGGLIALGVDLVTGESEIAKGVISLGGGFVAAAMGAEKIAAGVAGGYAYGLGQRLGRSAGFLSDDFRPADYADDDSMSEYPDALTEDGKALYLAEDGNLYLQDNWIPQDDGTYILADGSSPYDASLAVANY